MVTGGPPPLLIFVDPPLHMVLYLTYPLHRNLETPEYDAIRNNANDIEMALTDNIEELNTAALLKCDTYDLVKNPSDVLTSREKAGKLEETCSSELLVCG